MTVASAGKVEKSVGRPNAARLYIRRDGTERVASRVRSSRGLLIAQTLSPNTATRLSPAYKYQLTIYDLRSHSTLRSSILEFGLRA